MFATKLALLQFSKMVKLRETSLRLHDWGSTQIERQDKMVATTWG